MLDLVEENKLKALIELVAEGVIRKVEERQRVFADEDRLCYTEPEAAWLLAMRQHQLRDERARGRITYTRVVGNRIRYRTADLLKYLEDREGQ